MGDDTPTGSGAYAKLAGDPRVFTIGSFVKTSLDKNAERPARQAPAQLSIPTSSRAWSCRPRAQPVEFGKNGQSEWQILKPRPLRADSSAGERPGG